MRGPQGRQEPGSGSSTPQQQQQQQQQLGRPDTASQQSGGPCHTPQECATMLEAMEHAMQQAQECTPESHPSHAPKPGNLQDWLKTAGLQLPTPAARDLQTLVEAAADNRHLRKQLEALREAELELAAREAEETALSFSMLEEENYDLAARNAAMQQRIAELEALAEAAEAAAQAQQQQQQEQGASESPEPFTPQHQRTRGLGALCDEGASMQERATSVLKRAAAASRLSGMYEEEQQAKLRQLTEAEGRLSAIKTQAPGSTQSQHTAMQQRLSAAEQQVQQAAQEAREATAKLQEVLQEREEVQGELQALRQQLEDQPNAAAQHAELYTKLLGAQQQLLHEKQHSQQLAGSLLEHAGRLSHKYYNLSDDYDALEHRYHQLTRANERLAGQLKEAHEALFEVQAAVQATPVHKQKQQQHLVSRLHQTEEAVMSLAQEKQQLQERLLQAHAFIACLQQRTGATAASAAGAAQAPGRGQSTGSLMQTPSTGTANPAAVTPQLAALQDSALLPAAAASGSEGAVLALPAPPGAADSAVLLLRGPAVDDPNECVRARGGASSSSGFATPAQGHSASLVDMPVTRGTQLASSREPGAVHAATATAPPEAPLTRWPTEPLSPILAAATARSRTVGEQRSAASHELQDVQQGQLGLRDEISRAKSALADIAGQLRASIGGAGSTNAAVGAAAHPAASSRSAAAAALQQAGDGTSSSSRSHAGLGAARRPAAAAALSARTSSSTSSSSGDSRDTAGSGSRGSRAAAAGRAYGPARLQELHKAAAAVKSASAARSARSSASASSAAAKPGAVLPDFCFSSGAPGVRASHAEGDMGSKAQWDQLSDSSAGSSPRSRCVEGFCARPAASAPAAAPAPAPPAAPAGSAASSAGADQGSLSSQQVRAAGPCVSAPGGGAASGSAKGSISLDQLIADAESVSLEYGMSPGGYAGNCAAAAASGSTAVAAAAAGASSSSSVNPQQQQQQQGQPEPFAFASGQVALLTPGSAASSAGAGGPKPAAVQAVNWHRQQQWELTPASLAGPAAATPGDMQSCMRGAGAAAAAAPGQVSCGTPVAATPAGLERVASNTALDAWGAASTGPGQGMPAERQDALALQLQQQDPAGSTPTNFGGFKVAAASGPAAAAAAASYVQQQGGVSGPQASAYAASTAKAAVAGVTGQSSHGSHALPGAPGSVIGKAACSWAAAQEEVQQQQQGSEVAPVKPAPSAAGSTLTAPGAAADAAPTGAVDVGSPPSALKKAAAALLASISPAGLVGGVTMPDAAGHGATPAGAATTASLVGSAGLSPQLLQHLTPEWLRSLKRKCKQESEQLQQLRRQMGLATPEAQLAAQQQQHQGSASRMATPAASALAASPQMVAAVLDTPAAASSVAGAQPVTVACAGDVGSAAGAGAVVDDSGTPPTSRVADEGAAPAATTTEPESCRTGASSSSGGARAPAAQASHTGASLGAASSRSNIDRLRRRAIMAQATAAAACDGGATTAADADAHAGAAAAPSEAYVGAVDASGAGADVAARQAALAAAAAAAAAAETGSLEDPLDRTSSTGSLADYMRCHSSSLRDDGSAPVSRTGSTTPAMLPSRPECPTPGSLYSDLADALGSAEDEPLVGSGRDSPVSPDMLLAGLRSSRLAARQLQQQLMQQLEKTASLPSILSRQHEGALAAVLAGSAGGLPRTSSAAAAVAAGAAAAAGRTDSGSKSAALSARWSAAGDDVDEESSGCDSPAMEASTQLIAVGQPTAASAASGRSAGRMQALQDTSSSSLGGQQQQQRHGVVGRLIEQAEAASGSPCTPGAALNAGAESRLLSPGAQLQLVFDAAASREGAGDGAASGLKPDAAAELRAQSRQQQEEEQQKQQESPEGSFLVNQTTAGAQQQVGGASRMVAAGTPAASEVSSCMLPLGVAAKPQPGGESAVAAPSPPAVVVSFTPGFSGALPQGSIRAHQLTSLSAGTVTASAVTPQVQDSCTDPLSCARAPQSAQPSAAFPAEASSASRAGSIGAGRQALSGVSQGSAAAAVAASSTSRSTPASSQAASSQAGPSLGSWAGRGAGTSAAAGLAAAQTSTPSSSVSGSVTKGAAAGSSSVSAAQPPASVSRSSGTTQQQQEQQWDRPSHGLPIILGDSPSSRPQCQQQQQLQQQASPSFSSASTSWAAGAGAEATPGSSTSLASDSCLSGSVSPAVGLSLGFSPGSASAQSEPATAAAAPARDTAAVCVDRSAAAAAPDGIAQGNEVPSPPAEAAGAAGAATPPWMGVELTPGTAAEVAAVAAAVEAAFALPIKPAVFNPNPPPNLAAAAPPPAAAATAAGPAASSTTWGSGSCVFATPAAAFDSPGGTTGACCASGGSEDGRQYYTGQQGSSCVSASGSGGRRVAASSAAATSRHRALGAAAAAGTPEEADSDSPAAAAVAVGSGAGVGTTVAFAGFRVLTEHSQAAAEEALASPVMTCAAAANAPPGAAAVEGAAGGVGGAGVRAMTATAQKRLLQELLGSPGDSDDDSLGSDGSPTAVTVGMAQGQELYATQQEAPSAATAAGAVDAVSPAPRSASTAGQQRQEQQVLSPTLSELGFVAASASADVAAAKCLQQQQEAEAAIGGAGRGRAADLAGLSFEQRLDLLCAEDGSADEHSSSSPQSPLQSPGDAAAGAGDNAAVDAAAQGSAGWVGAVSPSDAGSSHSSHVACCATQTSPLPQGVLSAGPGPQAHATFREAGVQVPTPAHHGPQAKQEAASSSRTPASSSCVKPAAGLHGPRPCDVSASPIKGRDQC